MNIITKKLQFLRHKPSRLAVIVICLVAVAFSTVAFLRFDSSVQYGIGARTTDAANQSNLNGFRPIAWNDLKGSSENETHGITPGDFQFQDVYDDDPYSTLSVKFSIVLQPQISSYQSNYQDLFLSLIPKSIPQRSPPLSV